MTIKSDLAALVAADAAVDPSVDGALRARAVIAARKAELENQLVLNALGSGQVTAAAIVAAFNLN